MQSCAGIDAVVAWGHEGGAMDINIVKLSVLVISNWHESGQPRWDLTQTIRETHIADVP
jgi:hypothetical protein